MVIEHHHFKILFYCISKNIIKQKCDISIMENVVYQDDNGYIISNFIWYVVHNIMYPPREFMTNAYRSLAAKPVETRPLKRLATWFLDIL